jgi:hypothetical protein
MPPALLPDPGPDDPDAAHDDQTPGQGLYITLPAEHPQHPVRPHLRHQPHPAPLIRIQWAGGSD